MSDPATKELNELPAAMIDLSKLPKRVQSAVGADISRSIASRLDLTKGPIIIGELDPSIWGFIQPDFFDEGEIPDGLRTFLERGLNR